VELAVGRPAPDLRRCARQRQKATELSMAPACPTRKSAGNDGSVVWRPTLAASNEKTVYIFKMPKAGGSSFILELVQWTCAYLTTTTTLQWSEHGRGLLEALQQGAMLGMMLREPIAHVISMYNHCQNGQGKILHHYTPISLDEWLTPQSPSDSSQSDPAQTNRSSVCSYSPFNFQTTRLQSALARNGSERSGRVSAGSLDRIVDAIRRTAGFVGATHRMKESLCVASFTIFGHLPADGRCACEHGGTVMHNTHGIDHDVVDKQAISQGTLKLLWEATRTDQILYAHGLQRFYSDARRVEQLSGVRILCDL